MKKPKAFVKKLLSEVDLKFTGDEIDINKEILNKLFKELKKQKKSYKRLDDNSAVFEKAVKFLKRRGKKSCPISDVYYAFSDKPDRTTINFGILKNRAEAGIIIRTIDQYYFGLDEDVLDGVPIPLNIPTNSGAKSPGVPLKATIIFI
jgi:hypothetical protein